MWTTPQSYASRHQQIPSAPDVEDHPALLLGSAVEGTLQRETIVYRQSSWFVGYRPRNSTQTHGWLLKLWSLLGYPQYQVPYYNGDPKGDHNFDNHPYNPYTYPIVASIFFSIPLYNPNTLYGSFHLFSITIILTTTHIISRSNRKNLLLELSQLGEATGGITIFALAAGKPHSGGGSKNWSSYLSSLLPSP